jgi:SAM-dependent methyltransferase
MNDTITFSFGKNWRAFINTISDDSIRSAQKDIEDWLDAKEVKGKTILDIGCGSGIHSLVFTSMGAREVISFDADIKSIESTSILRERAGTPLHWKVMQGSVLDKQFLANLGAPAFDVVYSWGVLHHTGAMWEAVGNACSLVKQGGLFWIALYRRGPNYEDDLALKKRYNAAGTFGKRCMVANRVSGLMFSRCRRLKNPFAWNENKSRGMDTYHDIIDWLGGLPYEVASDAEVTDFLAKRHFVKKRIDLFPEGCNNIYLYMRMA